MVGCPPGTCAESGLSEWKWPWRCGEGAGVELAEGGKDPRGWPVGASVHDAKSGINRLSLRGLPDASPEMGGVSGVGGVVACSLVRFYLSV